MKLVFVNRFYYPDISATSQLLTDATRHLAKSNSVHVVTSRLTYEGNNLLTESEIDGVVIHRVWTTRFGRRHLIGRAVDYITFYLSTFFKLLFLLSKEDTVIVKTDPPLISVPVSWVARIKGARLINWLQDVFPEVAVKLGINMPGPVVSFLTMLRDNSLLSAFHNIAIGQKMRTILLKQGVRTDQVTVIPNWSDSQLIQPKSDNRLKEAWGLQDRFVIGYSGNLGRAHIIDGMLGAIRVLQEPSDPLFLFIGGGAEMDRLQDIVHNVRLNNVRFEPYQPRDQLTDSLTLPDIHLLSLNPQVEGLIVPSKIYGILAAGRPVINLGSPDGEIAALIDEHQIGVTVDPYDGVLLHRAIQQLREGDIHAMGTRAREVFLNHYDKPIALEKLERVVC